MEQILGLETDALISRLGPSRRAGPDVHEEFASLVGEPDGLAGVLEAVGCAETDALVSTGGSVTVDVGVDRTAHTVGNRIVWRARRDGVARTATYLQLESPSEEVPAVRAIQGCRLGRCSYDEAGGFVAWELVLDRALGIGETAITEVAYEIRETESLTRYACVAERRISEGVLWVRFDQRDLPRELHSFETVAGLEHSRPTPLVGSSAHHVVQGFGPGSFGLDWSW